MPVIIKQGKNKIIAMPGIFVGADPKEDEQTMKEQQEYFKHQPEIVELLKDPEAPKTIMEMLQAMIEEEKKNE